MILSVNHLIRAVLALAVPAVLSSCNTPRAKTLPLPDPPAQERTPVTLSVVVTDPVGPVFTNGSVTLIVRVEGGTPASLQSVVDGQPVGATVDGSSVVLDTQSLPEGEHAVTVRAALGEQVFDSDALRVTVDRTPPRVLPSSRVPQPGSNTVPVGTAVRVRFSEALKPSSLTASSVLFDRGESAARASWRLADGDRQLDVLPEGGQMVASSSQVRLTNAITDLAGNALDLTDAVWSWRVPGFVRVGAALDSRLEDGAGAPQIAVDANGVPTIVWLEHENTAPGVFAASRVMAKRWNGQTWVRLGSPVNAGDPAGSPSLVLDASGWPVVAWCAETDQKNLVFVNRWDGASWRSVGGGAVNAVGFSCQSAVPVALDARGNPVIGWISVDVPTRSVDAVAYRFNGSSWERMGDTVLDVDPSRYATEVALTADRNGTVFASWTENGSGLPAYLYVKKWDGSSWNLVGTDALNLSSANQAFSSRIAVDARGYPVVLWTEYDYRQMLPHVKRWNGSAWVYMGPVCVPENSHEVFNVRGALTLDASNNPVVAALVGRYDAASLEVKRWTGSTWEMVGNEALGGGFRYGGHSPAVSVDAAGDPVVAWSEYVHSAAGEASNVYVAQLNK